MNRTVGRYNVIEQIGRGGMGVVYLAEDPVLNRRVAIKTVELAADDPKRQEFLRERLIRDGRAAAGLSHPNIVSVYDVMEEGECGYLVMEYIAGESLSAFLRRTPRPDVPFIARVLREMASALDYTHARGIVHRDVKPANVMLDATGAAKIMDFGIARIASTRTNTPTGTVMGTLEYMAPEQIMGESVDGRADEFSLAAVAYEMLSGTTIYGEQSFATLTYKIVNEMPPPLRTHVPDLPPGVEEVVARALRKKAAERFPTCGGFASALERAFAGEVPSTGQVTVAIPAASGSEAAAAVTPSGKRGVLVGVAGVAGAVVLGAGLLLWKPWAKSADSVTVTPATQVAKGGEPAATAPPVPPPAPKPKASTQERPSEPKTAAPEAPKATGAAGDRGGTDADAGEASAPPGARSAFAMAEQAVQAGRYPMAIQQYTRAINQHPKFMKARFGRGAALQHQNRYREAIEDYDAILQMNPRNAVALMQRGICHGRLNEDDAALTDLNRSLEIRRDIPMTYVGRGLISVRRKEFAKALADFSEAIRISPEFAPAYRNRGMTEQAMGNQSAADADLKRAKELEARQGN